MAFSHFPAMSVVLIFLVLRFHFLQFKLSFLNDDYISILFLIAKGSFKLKSAILRRIYVLLFLLRSAGSCVVFNVLTVGRNLVEE